MDNIYSLILRIHIVFGALSLVLFWIPVFTRKGKKTHNRVGRWYVVLMSVVVLTAFLMCLDLLFRQGSLFGLGLGLMGFLTLQPLIQGYYLGKYRVMSTKFITLMKAMGISILLLSAINLYFGLTHGIILLLIFAGIGLSAGTAITRGFFKVDRYNHIATHLSGMLISGGAAYTAFLAFGASSFLPSGLTNSWWVLIPWVLPTVAALVASTLWRKKYPVKKDRIVPQNPN
ncbi:MAG: hypothetical protein V4616_08455 [Bacteroidota bacterium]